MLVKDFQMKQTKLITHNGWVYEKVCLDELSKLPLKLYVKLSYTPCYV